MTDKLRILLSNDDGVHAPGLKILEKIARTITDDIWIVAPSREQSGAAHSLTLNRPLRAHKVEEKKFFVDGTPTDCVLMAIKELIPGKKPDLMLSGVNAGSNSADDVTYSGTIAAAMEATLLGVPSIALSQELSYGKPIKWETAEKFGIEVVKKLISTKWPQEVLMNVNFPNVDVKDVVGVHVSTQGLREDYRSLVKATDPRGAPYYWIGSIPEMKVNPKDQTDLAALHRKQVSVTPLHLDLTHMETYKKLVSLLNHD